MQRVKAWARALKVEAYAVYLAARHPRTPWYARLVALLTAAHTFSPIDLIPDFIPVLGYLDDLLIVPLGLWLALRLIPPDVMVECRQQAQVWAEKPVSRLGAALVLTIWLLGLGLLVAWAWGRMN